MFSWETNIQYDSIQKVYIAILLLTTISIHLSCVLSLMKWDGIVMCLNFLRNGLYLYILTCVRLAVWLAGYKHALYTNFCFDISLVFQYLIHTLLVGHYSDVIIRVIACQITCISIVCSTICLGADQNIKAPGHWPLWGESIGDRWIPLTKGQ